MADEVKNGSDAPANSSLRKVFAEFLADPTDALRIAVRGRRASELRSLLAKRGFDLATFNREVWTLAEPRKPGEKASLFERLFSKATLSDQERTALETELKSPGTILRGNWLWRAASGVLGPALKSGDQGRLQAARDAAGILTDQTLSPLEKAKRIDDLEGFGLSVATGLVMVFHPKDFAIYNDQSKSAMIKMGLSSGSLEEFEHSASQLRTEVGAADFIELDWFLYQLNQGNIQLPHDGPVAAPTFWWVNQRQNFDTERNGGFIRSPKKDKGGKTPFQYENVSRVKPGDFLFHYAKGIRAISIAASGAMDKQAAGAEWTEDWDGWQVKTAYEDLTQPIAIETIAEQIGRLQTSQNPIGSDGRVQSKYLFRLEGPAARVIAQQIDLASISSAAASVLRALLGAKPHQRELHMSDLNLILYGPPGTGKTYRTIDKAVFICDGQVPSDRKQLMERFRALQTDNRIAFVTFHQSYGYEEFVEGIRPVLTEDEDAGDEPTDVDPQQRGDVQYERREGIFRKLCALAAEPGKQRHSKYDFDPSKITIWKMSLGNSRDEGEAYIYDDSIENNYIRLGYGNGLDFTGCDTREAIREKLATVKAVSPKAYRVTAVHLFKNEMQPNDLVVVSEGNRKFRAIGRITGKYRFENKDGELKQLRSVEWLVTYDESLPREKLLTKNFSQRTLYRLRPSFVKMDALKELLSGTAAETLNYVLIIDEINRGNISKVFGELITLLEPDKRLGQLNELKVNLPYSGKDFGVPPNLYVLGTMNTADRSIAFLDTALRRRFKFEEMLPQIEVLRNELGNGGIIGDVEVPKLLSTLNERIEFLFDRDHQIGHAYLLDIASLVDLRDVFLQNIVPLLQEYFYGDWEKLGAVLGCVYDTEAKVPKTSNMSPILTAIVIDGSVPRGFDLDAHQRKLRYNVSNGFIHAGEDQLAPYFQQLMASTPSATATEDEE